MTVLWNKFCFIVVILAPLTVPVGLFHHIAPQPNFSVNLCDVLMPGMIGYGMAKAAVHQLVQSLASEGSGLPKGVFVTAILP